MKRINFSELNFSNFYYWPYSLNYWLLLFLGILILVSDYVLILSEYSSQYKNLVNEEMNLKKEFETKYQQANLQAYQTQLRDLQNLYGKRLMQLVKKNEVSNLLNDLSQAAVSSGLIIEFFAPYSDENKNKNLLIKMDVVGEYQQLSLFISKIYALSKLISFENFSVAREGGESAKNDELLRMKTELKIKRYDD